MQIGSQGGRKIGATGGQVIASAENQPCCCGGPAGDCPCQTTGPYLATCTIQTPVAQCDPESDQSCSLPPWPGVGTSLRDGGLVPGTGYAPNYQANVYINSGPDGPGCVPYTNDNGEPHVKCGLCYVEGGEPVQYGAGWSTLIPFVTLAGDSQCITYYTIKRVVFLVQWRYFPLLPGDPQFGNYPAKVRADMSIQWLGTRIFHPPNAFVILGGVAGASQQAYYTQWTPNNPGQPFPCCGPFSGDAPWYWYDNQGVECSGVVKWALRCPGQTPPGSGGGDGGPIDPGGISLTGAGGVSDGGLLSMLQTGAAAIPKIAAAMIDPADAETQARRLAVCRSNECGVYNGGVCGEWLRKTGRSCGCSVAIKVRGKAETCPQGRW